MLACSKNTLRLTPLNTTTLVQPSASLFLQHWPNTLRNQHRNRSDIVYTQINQLVATTYGRAQDAIRIFKTRYGKPRVFDINQSLDSPIENCFISVSHSYDWSIWTLQPAHCALDIERCKPRKHLKQLLFRLLASIDYAHSASAISDDRALLNAWNDLDHATQIHCFYALWTFAEAWCKWQGSTLWQTFAQGLPFPWQSWIELANCTHRQIMDDCTLAFLQIDQYKIAVLGRQRAYTAIYAGALTEHP